LGPLGPLSPLGSSLRTAVIVIVRPSQLLSGPSSSLQLPPLQPQAAAARHCCPRHFVITVVVGVVVARHSSLRSGSSSSSTHHHRAAAICRHTDRHAKKKRNPCQHVNGGRGVGKRNVPQLRAPIVVNRGGGAHTRKGWRGVLVRASAGALLLLSLPPWGLEY
jgi:hypothetical protein